MGGGCDVIMAYMIANYLSDGPKENIMHANCIGERSIPEYINTIIENKLYYIDSNNNSVISETLIGDGYGTTKLEEMTVKITNRSLYIIPVKTYKDVDTDTTEDKKNKLESITNTNEQIMREVIEKLNINIVISIDTGGDSITGGKDWKYDRFSSRDLQVLHACRQLYKSNYINKLYHIVLGPCCDGETSDNDMVLAVYNKNAIYDSNFKKPVDNKIFHGGFILDSLFNSSIINTLLSKLKAKRTPNIIKLALDYKNNILDNNILDNNIIIKDNNIIIKRYGNIAIIPYQLLTIGLIFTYNNKY